MSLADTITVDLSATTVDLSRYYRRIPARAGRRNPVAGIARFAVSTAVNLLVGVVVFVLVLAAVAAVTDFLWR